MKKSYLTLAAVAMVMASCSNEVLVDNQEVKNNETEAMTFSTFSDLAVKGDATVRTNLEYYHNTFAVYGSKKSTVNGSVSQPFEAKVVTYANGTTPMNDWKYSPLVYWDTRANYNFIAVAPNTNIVEYVMADVYYTQAEIDAAQAIINAQGYTTGDNPDAEAVAAKTTNDKKVVAAEREVGQGMFATVAGGYKLVGQNLQATATTAEIVKGFYGNAGEDTDIMTSAKVAQGGATHVVGQPINLTFKHILAKLNIAVAKHTALDGVVITIKDIKVQGLDNKGEYSENANAGSWYNTSIDGAYELSFDNTNGQAAGEITSDNKLYFIESLVMPQAITASDATVTPAVVGEKVVVSYSITSTDGQNTRTEDYIFDVDLAEAFTSFVGGNNYTLTFNIMPDAIIFDASSTEWVDQNANGTIVVEN